jgi:mannosyltransferase OCH1-like enzyme
MLSIIISVLWLLYYYIYCDNSFKLVSVIKTKMLYYNGIPKIIFRTHKNIMVSNSMYHHCHLKWVELNPSYTIYWFDNQMCDYFMKSMGERIYKSYNNIRPGAYKADLWRACVLYKYGGVYVDSYTEPFQSLTTIFKGCVKTDDSHKFISVKEKEFWGIHNGFIACTPNHPFMKQYINDMIENIENKYYGNTDLAITGPVCLLNSINKTLNLSRKIYKAGWNNYNISFYLYEYKAGLYQPVYKNKDIIMHKKYSLLDFIKQRLIQYNTTYTSMWTKKQVYKL